MPQIVKYPSKAAGEPDKRFCGQCGRRCQPLINDNVGFGPCVDGASSVVDCADFRRAMVASFALAAQLGRPVHAETQALVARLGVPAGVIEQWLADHRRRAGFSDFLRRGLYGQPGGAAFMPALTAWMAEGHAGEKIIALLEFLKVHCDPTDGGSRPVSWLDICDWHERLGDAAKGVLSDPGDWEMGE